MATERTSGKNRFQDSNNILKSDTEIAKKDIVQGKTNNEVQRENEVKLDINSLFSKKKEVKSSSHTFYLKDENYKKLQSIAKNKGFSVSEVLNRILDQF